MDIFKLSMTHHTGISLHCPCCNNYHGKDKKKLNRMARAKLKKLKQQELKQEDVFIKDTE